MPTRRQDVFIQEFNDVEDIAREFSDCTNRYDDTVPLNDAARKILKELKGATIHLAWYGCGNYEGDSRVLFTKDDQLYMVRASHCSCNGLEGQWHPVKTTWLALSGHDISDGCDGYSEAQRRLDELLGKHGVGKA